MTLRWQDIREACEKQGLPIREWERELPHRMLNYFLDHVPRGRERYTTDSNLRNQCSKLIAMVVACVLDRDPLSDPAVQDRAEELGGIFRSEASTVRE